MPFGNPVTTAIGFGSTTGTPTFGSPSQFGTGLTQTNLSFGTPQQQQQPTSSITFGTPANTQAALNFGTPSAVATTAQTGLNFGTPTPTQTGITFGTPSGNFGQPTLNFGATPQPQGTGTGFGAPATTTPAFGAPAASSTFGTPTTTAFGAPGSSTGFGAPTTSTALGTFGASTFGTPTSTAFGVTPTPTFGTLPAGPVTTSAPTATFGTPGTLQFGTATTSAFGLPITTSVVTATTTPSLGFGLNAPTTSTAVVSTAPLSFGLGTATTAAKPLGLFGATPTATTAGLGFGTTNTTQSGFSLGTGSGLFGGKTFGTLGSSTTAATTTSSTASVGLGGLDPSQNKFGLAGSSTTRTENKAVKEIQVPNEIVETVDSFKNFLKTQKNLSSDVARGSTEPLNKVQEETERLRQVLGSLQNGIQRSLAVVVKLKSDTAKSLQNAEMAQRTHDTPPGLQYDNTAPLKYFQDLVSNFEHEMKVFKLEINNTEKHLHSLMQPMPLTSQELSLAMRRLHDSFVALAGHVQSVHNNVEAEKNQYLLIRKNYQKDSSNIFEEEAKKSILASAKVKSSFKASAGPTPFSALGGQHGFGLLSSSSTLSKPTLSSGWSGGQTQQFQSPQLQRPSNNFQQNQFSSTLSNTLFSGVNASSLTSPQPVENQNFQLQKPPLGNKRGKR